jgi:hypothetical protein
MNYEFPEPDKCIQHLSFRIHNFFYPCLCLNLGFFLLMTYNTPFLRTILQSALLFLMDVLTFIVT